jgi:Protein of unknown function (DUF1566)/Ankyrin repeats (many copies)/TerB-C domain
MTSLLHKAAKWGKPNLAKMLLNKGANINERDKYGLTPFDYAIKYGDPVWIEFLRLKGAVSGQMTPGNIDLSDRSEPSPAAAAMLSEQEDSLISLLIQMEQRAISAPPSRELINFVARHPDRINKPEEVSSLPAPALLHRAAFLGNRLVTAWLLIKGADINAIDGDNKTPLDHAVARGHQDLAEYLRRKGARSADERFLDNLDGTVTDRRTGLTWMRCASGQTWDGTTCTGEINAYTWNEAMTLHSTYAGHSDWRLPNIDELRSIVDSESRGPAIDTKAFPITTSPYFWSSSVGTHGSSYAWLVGFEQGQAGFDAKSGRFAVRHVRGGKSTAVGDVVNQEIAGMVANKPKRMPFGPTLESARNRINETKIQAVSETILDNLTLQEPRLTMASATIKHGDMDAPTQPSTQGDPPPVEVILERLDQLESRFDASISRIEAVLGSLLAGQSEALGAIDQFQQDSHRMFASALQLAKTTSPAAPQPTAIPVAETSAMDKIVDLTSWLVELDTIPLSELRIRLLPLDLLPGAVIDDINERALDLTGEPALVEDGDNVIVQREVLLRVIAG